MNPYEELSEDDHVAFLQIENEFRQEMERRQEEPNSSWYYLTADYMNKTLAAATALNIDALTGFSVNTREHDDHGENFNEFLRAVDNIIVQMRILNSRSRNAMTVGLTEAQKTKIHHLIEKIRGEVEASATTEDKKDKLFSILKNLAAEVSKNRTRYERFADLARSLATLSGDVEREGAQPWWPWFQKIMGLIGEAKDTEPQLPRPPEIKKIEPPRRELPKPSGGYDDGGNNKPRDLDDEIPF